MPDIRYATRHVAPCLRYDAIRDADFRSIYCRASLLFRALCLSYNARHAVALICFVMSSAPLDIRALSPLMLTLMLRAARCALYALRYAVCYLHICCCRAMRLRHADDARCAKETAVRYHAMPRSLCAR